jgi:hypothetical protein
MTGAEAAMEIETHRGLGEAAVAALAARAAMQPNVPGGKDGDLADAVHDRGLNLLDAWQTIAEVARKEQAAHRTYSPYDKEKRDKTLLFTALELPKREDDALGAKFCAPTSMRDVESTVDLWIERRALGGKVQDG